MSDVEKQEENLKFQFESARKRDIEQFVSVVMNIIKSVEKESIKYSLEEIRKRTPIVAARFYTKINIQLTTIMKYLYLVSYKDWLRIAKSKNSTITYETCEDYRTFCRLHYIEKRHIPTLARLIHYFNKSVPYTDSIMYPLRRAGFIWKQLPGTKKAVLIENPEQFQQRIQYLRNMKECRRNNLPILYVEFINLADIINMKRHYVAVVVSTLLGLVQTTFFQPNFLFSMRWLKEWIAILVQDIRNPHVVVLGVNADHRMEYKKEDTELNMSSPKKEIIEWLEFNDIPHNPDDHRAELYRLVQKFKKNSKPKHSIKEKIKSFGHHMVEQPRGIMNLTMIYAALNLKFKITEDSSTQEVKNFLEEFTLEEWRHRDDIIRKCEEKIYHDDIEMEIVMDKLMELGKYGCISGKETDSLDDFTPLLGRNKYCDMVIFD